MRPAASLDRKVDVVELSRLMDSNTVDLLGLSLASMRIYCDMDQKKFDYILDHLLVKLCLHRIVDCLSPSFLVISYFNAFQLHVGVFKGER